jgi:hypothetical protein
MQVYFKSLSECWVLEVTTWKTFYCVVEMVKLNLFEDKSFNKKLTDQGLVKWLRPNEICKKPQFVVDGFTRFDLKQGQLGDCWFIAAIAGLIRNPTLFHKVVPKDNSFDKGYNGVFRFK